MKSQLTGRDVLSVWDIKQHEMPFNRHVDRDDAVKHRLIDSKRENFNKPLSSINPPQSSPPVREYHSIRRAKDVAMALGYSKTKMQCCNM